VTRMRIPGAHQVVIWSPEIFCACETEFEFSVVRSIYFRHDEAGAGGAHRSTADHPTSVPLRIEQIWRCHRHQPDSPAE
jgi:hypothetical protein